MNAPKINKDFKKNKFLLFSYYVQVINILPFRK
jgi:hypothetical protein